MFMKHDSFMAPLIKNEEKWGRGTHLMWYEHSKYFYCQSARKNPLFRVWRSIQASNFKELHHNKMITINLLAPNRTLQQVTSVDRNEQRQKMSVQSRNYGVTRHVWSSWQSCRSSQIISLPFSFPMGTPLVKMVTSPPAVVPVPSQNWCW